MSNQEALQALGWGEPFQSAFQLYAQEGLIPARVSVEHRNRYIVLDGENEIDARLSGKLHRLLEQSGDRPVVGDWVAIQKDEQGNSATIQARLPRKSEFSRKVAGRTAEQQVMAANIDTVFLTTALTSDLNPRRIERYLLLGWESGANPVILLTKSDLGSDLDNALQQRGIEKVAEALSNGWGQTIAKAAVKQYGATMLQQRQSGNLRAAQGTATLGAVGLPVRHHTFFGGHE